MNLNRCSGSGGGDGLQVTTTSTSITSRDVERKRGGGDGMKSSLLSIAGMLFAPVGHAHVVLVVVAHFETVTPLRIVSHNLPSRFTPSCCLLLCPGH
jgi:hypothetical protein